MTASIPLVRCGRWAPQYRTLHAMANSGFSGLEDFSNQLSEVMHESIALELAQVAKANGLSTADSIEIDLDDGDAGPVDVPRVYRRANEILAGESSA